MPQRMAILKHLFRIDDQFTKIWTKRLIDLFFSEVISNNDGNRSFMLYLVSALIKLMSTIPAVIEYIWSHETYYFKLFDWVTDNPNPSDKNESFAFAQQKFNLAQLQKIKQNTDTEQNVYDSDEDISNLTFIEGDQIDIQFDTCWESGRVLKA